MDVSGQAEELMMLVRERMGEWDAQLIAKSAEMAFHFHDGQKRKLDGAPYVTHCLSVARMCLTWGLVDAKAICAALLHDAIEDAPPQLEAARRIQELSPEIYGLVEALSKIRDVQTGQGDMAATYRRILGAASKDLRVLLIKIFDNVNNAETLHVHGQAKSQAKASLGLVYVGVARRLGVMSLADLLVGRLLPYLMPQRYERALDELHQLQQQGADSMERLTQWRLKPILAEGFATDYTLEPKSIADFFYLTENPGTGRLTRIGAPVYRLRFLVVDDDSAWRVLGRLHSLFGPLPRHVRDYLNAPRINGFRALTSRILWEGNPLSVHVVRLRDEVANRLGVLAQWGVSGPDTQRYMRLLATLGDSDLRLSEVHAHVLPDLLDVYTPKGDRLTFPAGSVVLDFAYLVHTDLGNSCVGARVNGVMRPPDYPLISGDVVSVVTAKSAKPQRAWLDVVKTARARTMIKQALKSPDIPVRGVERGKDGFILTSLVGPDIQWSTCCLPVPDKPIVGRLSNDGHWIVHLADCDKVSGDNWENGRWGFKSEQDILSVSLTLDHRTGSLLEVLKLLAKRGINGHSLQGRGINDDAYTISIDLGGRDPVTLGNVLRELPTVITVREIQRYFWRH
ncbi:MAG: bifunctional (p)ppGpp synthetase/guanosine-3',5'-bis(diphosphate) 3'-pyrophosphohydrolase [Magnetococcales bacterium]|nr:bifunctional (p)ppGpp synthetase/guanosine-3',5'-bis(diphosphate) 3'-pyrophosphohydrolase [Magnetococcales bacterium]NGZ25493.1 bifunctional (p)ppGpp synthetase/guanosine-3',5'-bis(diphosphate) 3'-pyrophosphohydrolase [Magnetococcales bacterium]